MKTLRKIVQNVKDKWNGTERHDLSVNAFHKANPHLHNLEGKHAALVFQNHVHKTYGASITKEQHHAFAQHWDRIRTGKTTSVPITR